MVLRWLGGLLVVLFVIGAFAAHPELKRYRVPSESMQPTIKHGEIVNLDKGTDPKVGDVVVFHPPSSATDSTCPEAPADGEPCAVTTDQPNGITYVKRILAGPGDRIAFRDGGHAVVNGKRLSEPYIAACGGGEGCDYPRAVTVPDGTY